MNPGGRKNATINATGTEYSVSPHSIQVYVYNSGANYVFVGLNGTTLAELVAGITADTAFPIAAGAKAVFGVLELPSIATLRLACADGETTTVDIGWN